ncbi:Adhesion G Protein-Coupled Receptor F5 [Manis pentadactyla]|nr:Adhesion G Protein-Coupled Receptor F5 [Manis pentadactyla]
MASAFSAAEVAGLACGCDVEEKVKGNEESRTVSSGCLGIQTIKCHADQDENYHLDYHTNKQTKRGHKRVAAENYTLACFKHG